MRNKIQKIVIYSLLVTSSLVTVGCSPGGFSASSPVVLNSPIPSALPPSEVPPPNGSSESNVVPYQPQNPTEISLTGTQADDLFAALQRVGVVDNSERLGATTLIASEIECMTPVVSNPVTTCRLYTASSTLNMSPADALKVNLILSTSVGRVSNGTVGATTARAYSISCSKIVYPGATATCSFSSIQ
jgi:hypothetical protein